MNVCGWRRRGFVVHVVAVAPVADERGGEERDEKQDFGAVGLRDRGTGCRTPVGIPASHPSWAPQSHCHRIPFRCRSRKRTVAVIPAAACSARHGPCPFPGTRTNSASAPAATNFSCNFSEWTIGTMMSAVP